MSSNKERNAIATRAWRLRKKVEGGGKLTEEEAEFMRAYQANQQARQPPIIDVEAALGAAAKAGADVGASKSARKVKLEVEEEQQSAGTGSAASPAASGFAAATATLMSREEGRRLDALTINAVKILETAVGTYEKVATSSLKMLEAYQQSHLETLHEVRRHYIARMQAEGDLINEKRKSEDSKDPGVEMALAIIAQALGIDIDKLTGAVNGMAGGAASEVPQ